jgi:hypothetical protein
MSNRLPIANLIITFSGGNPEDRTRDVIVATTRRQPIGTVLHC